MGKPTLYFIYSILKINLTKDYKIWYKVSGVNVYF